jgi:hypothetical protein
LLPVFTNFDRHLFISLFLTDYKAQNGRTVKKLNEQIKGERFEEIYDQASSQMKTTISKKDFVEGMKLAPVSMKEIDESLNWKNNGNQDDFYRDYSVNDTFYGALEKDNRRIGIFIYWTDNFILCGFGTCSSDKTGEIKVIQACS